VPHYQDLTLAELTELGLELNLLEDYRLMPRCAEFRIAGVCYGFQHEQARLFLAGMIQEELGLNPSAPTAPPREHQGPERLTLHDR
jgi:hypothetical protein